MYNFPIELDIEFKTIGGWKNYIWKSEKMKSVCSKKIKILKVEIYESKKFGLKYTEYYLQH